MPTSFIPGKLYQIEHSADGKIYGPSIHVYLDNFFENDSPNSQDVMLVDVGSVMMYVKQFDLQDTLVDEYDQAIGKEKWTWHQFLLKDQNVYIDNTDLTSMKYYIEFNRVGT
jgi:hypothetical protein